MMCPHGCLDAASCPECMRVSNVKPLLRAGAAHFTEFLFTRDPAMNNDHDVAPHVQERHIEGLPVGVLQPRRLRQHDDLSFSIPGNNGFFRARLEQLMEPTTDLLTLQDAIEKHVNQIRKHTFNPRVTEE